MRTFALLLAGLTACLYVDEHDDGQGPSVIGEHFNCSITYRCEWQVPVATEQAFCAKTTSEAEDFASDAGLQLMETSCAVGRWISVSCARKSETIPTPCVFSRTPSPSS
jgi:hypothetical protein